MTRIVIIIGVGIVIAPAARSTDRLSTSATSKKDPDPKYEKVITFDFETDCNDDNEHTVNFALLQKGDGEERVFSDKDGDEVLDRFCRY